jgi:23S rRNA pseudouridine2605 synthase
VQKIKQIENKVSDDGRIRLQKVLAAAGVASRRVSEQLILDGRVEVDDKVVTELGTRVDPQKQEVRFDGELVRLKPGHKTIALYKPVGIVSTMSDPEGRPTLLDVVGDRYGRLFHIGRLDTDSEGLILMTNDGDLAQRISHPSSEMPKTYVVNMTGELTTGQLKKLLKGVELKDGFAKFDKAKILGTNVNESMAEVVLHSGKNRIVRRMFKEVGHKVTRLVRTQIGPIRIGELKPGHNRVLQEAEVKSLESFARNGKKTGTRKERRQYLQNKETK